MVGDLDGLAVLVVQGAEEADYAFSGSELERVDLASRRFARSQLLGEEVELYAELVNEVAVHAAVDAIGALEGGAAGQIDAVGRRCAGLSGADSDRARLANRSSTATARRATVATSAR